LTHLKLSSLEFGNHCRICLKTGESNHACDRSRQTPTAIYMLISTTNPPLSIQMLSVTCIININKCRSNVLCMLQHKIRYLDVLVPKKPASDGCFSNEISLPRPAGRDGENVFAPNCRRHMTQEPCCCPWLHDP